MTEQRDRLRQAREKAGFTSATDAARRFHWSEVTYRSHENGNRDLSRKAAQQYAEAYNVDPGWLLYGEKEGTLPTIPVLAPNASAPFDVPTIGKRRIPVMGACEGGADGAFHFNGEMVDTVFCPPGFENVKGLYALFVEGESMSPRYEPGETVWVNPTRSPRKGDYVVAQIRNDDDENRPKGYVKRFIARTPTRVILEQFNPAKELEFDSDDVISLHKIVFQAMT